MISFDEMAASVSFDEMLEAIDGYAAIIQGYIKENQYKIFVAGTSAILSAQRKELARLLAASERLKLLRNWAEYEDDSPTTEWERGYDSAKRQVSVIMAFNKEQG